MSPPSERRKDRRLGLNLNVEFTPGKSSGVAVPCSGTTLNVSAGGVFFETDAAGLIENGMAVFLKIGVPKHAEGSPDPLVLHCEGTVCRIEELPEHDSDDKKPLGVAVRFNNRPNIEFQWLSELMWELG